MTLDSPDDKSSMSSNFSMFTPAEELKSFFQKEVIKSHPAYEGNEESEMGTSGMGKSKKIQFK